MKRGARGLLALTASTTAIAATLMAPTPSASGAFENPWSDVTWSTPEAASPVGVDVDKGRVWPITGGLLALWSVDSAGHEQVFSSVKPDGGSWSAPAQVSDFTKSFDAFANYVWDVNDSGEAVVAWTQYDTIVAEWTIRAATRSSAGTWAPPTEVVRELEGPVGASNGQSKGIAIGPGGQATLVFVGNETAADPIDDFGPDDEVFRVGWSGSSWGTAEEVSSETPLYPINCNELNPDDCPDREGDSAQPVVAYDGDGQEWIAWVHEKAAGEAAEDSGVFLRGTEARQLAGGSSSQASSFTMGPIAADPDGGVAVAWRRQVQDVVGQEVFAHARTDLTGSGATSRIATSDLDATIRGLAMRSGDARAVLGKQPSGIDGSRALLTAQRDAGSGSWQGATPMVVDGSEVYGTGGRAALTSGGVPVVAYAASSSDSVRVLAPVTSGWWSRGISGDFPATGNGTLVHGLAVAPDDALVASWFANDGDDRRLVVSVSDGPPGPTTPPAPVPTPTVTAPAPGSVALGTHVVRWNAIADATYAVRYRRAAWNGGFGAYATPPGGAMTNATSLAHSVSPGATWCYSVMAGVGDRTGAWSSERCTITPLDQTSLAKSTGWRLQKSGAYYGGSALKTTKVGKTLKRTGARVARVGVVATTCPSCGKVVVFIGATKIGRISLRSAGTHHRRVLLLPPRALRSGTIKVKVVTSGKLVRIDGLVVGAR